MRSLYRIDLAPQRRESEAPVSAGDTPIWFGALLICFVFATVFVSLGWGLPT